ncbi:MAG TPA: zinc ribbon domain-containing protein [Ignavibacteriales bacterium]|nr:zinc ribbon domain-containing protein [Ignavibacteriales bacterium]HOL80264.1 zinc ribbon domain-containing protein [Ignavibacteriales bacterium]HOM64544.1 zinc ribbon domain-containing protein [Ignavibacteriales bacterium]HPD66641.1 zinc ribbon domain-containing protein [Ignavibacteriales bacterium]HPP32453.1 zinc ribbon domain-containing protein [Ignavibacteriales bacterium]
MPTYEYHCKTCNKNFEVFQKISDNPISTCPDCGSPVKKIISGGAGLIFNGTGYYLTDYKSKTTQSSNNSSANN